MVVYIERGVQKKFGNGGVHLAICVWPACSRRKPSFHAYRLSIGRRYLKIDPVRLAIADPPLYSVGCAILSSPVMDVRFPVAEGNDCPVGIGRSGNIDLSACDPVSCSTQFNGKSEFRLGNQMVGTRDGAIIKRMYDFEVFRLCVARSTLLNDRDNFYAPLSVLLFDTACKVGQSKFRKQ